MMSLSSFTFYVVYYPLHHRILLRLFPGTLEYLPILYVDRLKIMNKHLEVSPPLSVVWERERRSRKSVISLSPSPLPLLPLTPLTPSPPPPPLTSASVAWELQPPSPYLLLAGQSGSAEDVALLPQLPQSPQSSRSAPASSICQQHMSIHVYTYRVYIESIHVHV